MRTPTTLLKILSLTFGILFSGTAVTAQAPYCSTSYDNGCASVDDEIDDVILANLNRTNSGCSSGNYEHYTADTIELNAGVSYTLSVANMEGKINGFRAWLDFDNDTGFGDPGEDLGGGIPSTVNTYVDIDFTVPLGAEQGLTRLRVRNDFDNIPSSSDSCGYMAVAWGEVEDYVVDILPPPSCISPTNLTASSIAPDSAVLEWTANNGTGNNWDVEYGPSGFTQGNGTTVNVSDTSYNLTGLNPNSSYDFYVREWCNPSDSSFWSGPFTFSTPCAPYTAPFYEDFNNAPFSTGEPGSISSCWDRTPSVDGEYIWLPEMAGEQNSTDTGPIDDIPGGGNYMYTEGTDGSSGDHATLTTPWIDMSSLTLPHFRFYYHFYGVEMDTFLVHMDKGSGWTGLDTIIGEQHSSEGAAWTPHNEFLNNSAGDTARFRFEAVQGNGYECDYAIDSVMVKEAPSCPVPTDLNANALNPDSVELSWTNAGTGNEWQVEYGPLGFTQGNGSDTLTITGNPDTVSNLPSGTYLDFYVRQVCSAGDTSSWSMPATALMPCDVPYTAPYSSGFDQTSTDLPLCWSVIEEPGNYVQVVNSTDDGFDPASMPQMVELNGNSPGGAPDTTVLISPQFSDLPAADKRIRFKVRKEIGSWADSLIIGTMSDNGDFSTWTPYDIVFNNEIPEQSWATITRKLDSSSLIGSNEYIGLMHDTGRTWELYVDDFVYETIPASDAGVTSIEYPTGETGCVINNAEIQVEVKNYGTDPKSNFDVAYTINGGSPVVETISQTLQPDSTMVYTFAPTNTLSTGGTYEIEAYTELPNDTSAYNDTAEHEIFLGAGSMPPISTDARAIPEDDATIEDTLFVCGTQNEIYECGRILKLRIDSLYHEDALDELDIQLVSPEGTTLDLWMQLGESDEQEMVDLDLTDTASQNITAATGAPYTGAWNPEEAAGFAKFQGEQLNGMWRLRIFNDDYGDTASLHGWSMQILDPDRPQPDLGPDTTICQDASLQLDPGQDPNWSYEWNDNSTEPTLPVVADFLTPLQSYSYSVMVTDQQPLNGCSNSDSIEVYVDTCKTTSIEEHGTAGISFELRPNPASDRVFIQSNGMNEPFRYDLIDLQGRTIKSKSSEAAQRSSLDVSGITKGVYIIKGYRQTNGEQLFQQKLVIE